jgi:hypothetical protein
MELPPSAHGTSPTGTREHGLLIASMREQGGHDFEVGNHGFVFRSLADIAPEKAVPINLLDPNYRLKSNGSAAVQGRFPVSGGFVPRGAKLPDGSAHLAAGTDFLFSGTLTFLPDRTQGHPDAGKDDRDIEFVQIRWDGSAVKVVKRGFSGSCSRCSWALSCSDSGLSRPSAASLRIPAEPPQPAPWSRCCTKKATLARSS